RPEGSSKGLNWFNYYLIGVNQSIDIEVNWLIGCLGENVSCDCDWVIASRVPPEPGRN
ncbi:hypothetical protein AAFF_G00324380, partial [Aldrovandia affinis]